MFKNFLIDEFSLDFHIDMEKARLIGNYKIDKEIH